MCCAAQEALAEGMESLSQAKVGSALQVFFNLDELDKVRVRARAHDFCRKGMQAVACDCMRFHGGLCSTTQVFFNLDELDKVRERSCVCVARGLCRRVACECMHFRRCTCMRWFGWAGAVLHGCVLANIYRHAHAGRVGAHVALRA